MLFQLTLDVTESAPVVVDTGGLLADPIVFAVLAGAAALLGIGLFFAVLRAVLHNSFRARHGFDMAVMLVTLPKESAEKKGEQERAKSLQEIQEDISVAETLFSTLGGLRAERGIGAWLRGRKDHFAFEIVAKGGMVAFYVATPTKYAQYIVQQIQTLHPNAHIEDVDDYNVFVPQGATVGSFLKLQRHHLYPIKTYRQIEADPVDAITNALSKVEKDEGAAVQFVLRSARREWRRTGVRVANEMNKGKSAAEAIASTSLLGSLFGSGARKTPKPGEAPREQRQLSPLEQEMQKAVQEKSSKAGLDVIVRVVASARDPVRAQGILANITDTFGQYNLYEYGNSFVKGAPGNRAAFLRDFIFRSFREKHAFVLGAHELASLFHFPLPTTETPNILWLTARKAPPPQNMPAEGIVMGKVQYRGEETMVRIKKPDRRRHVYIIGKSGSGKSVLIENMALQDIANGDGVCVVDPHGDLVEHILEQMPENRIDDVIVFDPSDLDRPIGLNMLEVESEEQKDFAVQEMIAIFYKLFPPEMIGPMFEHNMRNVMLTLMADAEETGTIAEIPRMFSDADFQKQWVAKVQDPVVRAFWEKEMAKTSDFHKSEMLGYLISKVGRFVENTMMRNIIGQRVSGFSIRKAMDQKKVLLVNLSKGKTGEVNANLLGLIIVSKLQMAALSRADLPEDQRHDFYLYIDEFQNFITDSIATILSEARKYRLNLIIAHQYMGQLVQNNDTKIRDAVIGNVGTMMLFRIGIEDAELLEKEFAPTFNAYDLINVEQYTAYVKLLIDNTASKPFNMKTVPPKKGNPELAAAIKELSRFKHGKDRGRVEAEILERTQLGAAAPTPPVAERTP